MSLQLVCINYGSGSDALKVIRHCMKIFPRFESATLLHPGCWLSVNEEMRILKDERIHIISMCKSKTQNECCLYEMPQYITCDHALGIQWDGFIVNPEAWTDEFLEYDLVAPPWPLENLPNPDWRVGSGGFCLFSKRFAQAWGKICKPHPAPNTDWDYGALDRDKFEALGMKYAPLELAARFGKEHNLEDMDIPEGSSFGFHDFRINVEYRKRYKEMVYG